jgi:hypothetical protein
MLLCQTASSHTTYNSVNPLRLCIDCRFESFQLQNMKLLLLVPLALFISRRRLISVPFTPSLLQSVVFRYRLVALFQTRFLSSFV